MNDQCSFCVAPGVDSVTVEAGNNAELEVLIHCCNSHMTEMEENCAAFEKKYSDRINELAAENGRRYEL